MPVDLCTLRQAFAEYYEGTPRLFRAPGRINLIGEHTDYNEGFVLPMAIKLDTVVAGRKRDDSSVRVRSLNKNEAFEFALSDERTKDQPTWTNYIEGVCRALMSRGAKLSGADLLLLSDIPEGAGLSSSAALEVSVGLAMISLAHIEIDSLGLVLAAQQAEHEYLGTKSGIMDQYVAVFGQLRHALLIDCRSLQSSLAPLPALDLVFVICNTGVKHELALSEYNVRRAQCERGVGLLREVLPGIRALRDVSLLEFRKYEKRLPEPIRARCRHVVTENERTLRAAEALRRNDVTSFGTLMYQSHDSLRDDFEVSCPELDALVELASLEEGVIGARMTGGGFGGCTINLVQAERLEGFRNAITRGYNTAFGRPPDIFVSDAARGAGEVSRRQSCGKR